MTNGQAKTVSKDQVRQAIRRKRLLQEEMQVARLERTARVSGMLRESVSLPDLWISSYWDQLRRQGSDFDLASSNMDRGKYFPGSNPPIFINEEQLRNLRNTARLLADWNGYARGLLSGIVSYVTGYSGFQIRVTAKKKVSKSDVPAELVERCQDIVDEELDRNDWRGGEQPGMEEELVRREHVDGEFFVAATSVDEGHTDLREVEPELVTQPVGDTQGHALADWSFGILNERHDVAKHLMHWVQWGYDDGEEIPPDRMTHLRRNVVRNVKRGLTSFYGDVVEALHGASALRRNMVEGAAIQASYSGVVQHDSATQAEVTDYERSVADYTSQSPISGRTETWKKHVPGMVQIPKGQNFVQPPTATNAAAHVEVLQAGLRAGGMWCNAPEWLVSGLHDTSSFASSLTAESPWTIFIRRDQGIVRKPFANIAWTCLRNRIDKAEGGVLAIKVAERDPASGQPTGAFAGRSYSYKEVERLLEIQVEGQSPETRNKSEDAQTATSLIQARLKSPQTVMQEQGLDVEQEISNMEEWDERMGQAGLALPMDKRLYDPKVAGEIQAQSAGIELPVEASKEGEQFTPSDPNATGRNSYSGLKVDAEGWVTTDSGHKLFIDDDSGEITKGNPMVVQAAEKKRFKDASKRTDKREKDDADSAQRFADTSERTDKREQAEADKKAQEFLDRNYPGRKLDKGGEEADEGESGTPKKEKQGPKTEADRKKEADAKKTEAEITNLAKSILAQAASKKDEEDEEGQQSQVPPPKGRSRQTKGEARGKQGPVLLEVPDRRQDTDYSCGPAALEAVASFYGIEVPEATLRSLSHTDKQVGTETDDLADAARQLGLKAQVMSGMELEDLQAHLDMGHPVIIGVQAYSTPEDVDPETQEADSGHYDVAIGYDAAKNSVTIQDPARAPDAGRQTVNADSFVKAWRLMADSGRWIPGIGIVISKLKAGGP